MPAPQGSRALAAEMRASCFGTPVRAQDTRKTRGQTARTHPEGGSREPRSENPPPGRPPARGARAEAPTCRQRAPKMDSSRPTRRQRRARAAGSSPGPHLDLGRGNRGGSAAVGARACSLGLAPPSDRHPPRMGFRNPKRTSTKVQGTSMHPRASVADAHQNLHSDSTARRLAVTLTALHPRRNLPFCA